MCQKCQSFPGEYKVAEAYHRSYRIIREKELAMREGLEQIAELSEEAIPGEDRLFNPYTIDTDTRFRASLESERAFADACIRKLCRQAAVLFAPGDALDEGWQFEGAVSSVLVRADPTAKDSP